MIANVLLLIVGLFFVITGANLLTDGAASIAKRFNLSELMIGLTILAFGTSAPELTVSISSALKGSSDIALGNVVGSNLFNILMIVGITAIISPLSIKQSTIRIEIPLCIVASILLLFLGSDMLFDGAAQNTLSRSDGLILLLIFAVFLAYTFTLHHDGSQESNVRQFPLWLSVLMVLGGLLALIGGGELFVNNSVAVAQALGMSESLIGLTLVAAGTSLPELATSIVAAMKNRHEMAIGNIVGSNLFNILLVLGASASISPLHVQGVNIGDYSMMVFASVLLYLFAVFFGDRVIQRIEGATLVFAFLAYMIVITLVK